MRAPIKHGLIGIGYFLALAIVAGGLAAWIGLVPVAASSGHWPITSWFLHFTMINSVELRSMTLAPPDDLKDPSLILRGAGHYHSGCAPCHGAPGVEQSLIARQMTPVPPYLPPLIPQWEAAELFWIVRHGIKFSAMPAWPALQRRDEIWAMTAFLQALPELSPQDYRRLSQGEPGAAQQGLLAQCARCHGVDGLGRGEGAFPKLAGQTREYLLASLQAYAEGTRHSGIMQPVAAAMTKAEMEQMAEYFAALKPSPTPGPRPALGERIALRGLPEKGIPACVQCHGPTALRAAIYPVLHGQYAEYLRLQLALFRQDIRGGTAFAPLMSHVAKRLTEQEIAAVSDYFAQKTPDSRD